MESPAEALLVLRRRLRPPIRPCVATPGFSTSATRDHLSRGATGSAYGLERSRVALPVRTGTVDQERGGGQVVEPPMKHRFVPDPTSTRSPGWATMRSSPGPLETKSTPSPPVTLS
jgi:hypothetical protein